MAFATCVPDRSRQAPFASRRRDDFRPNLHVNPRDHHRRASGTGVAMDRADGRGRAGWYTWDAIDNGGAAESDPASCRVPNRRSGDVMPAVPGAEDAFVVAAVDPPRGLVLTVPDGHGGNAVGWEHVLEPLDGGRTRLIVRGRASSQWLDLAPREAAHRSPAHLHRAGVCGARETAAVRCSSGSPPSVTAIMEARHLRGIQRRSTAASARRDVSGETWRKALLVCGILSSLLYRAMIWGDPIRGLRPDFSGSERADRHWRADPSALGGTG